MTENYYMIRCTGDSKKSYEFCTENGVVTYGWSDYNLSLRKEEDFEGIKINGGRNHHSFARKFSSIREGSVIILPSYGYINVGVAKSSCKYNPDWKDGDGANYIDVEWKGSYPRSDLSSNLQSSLKYRGTILEFWRKEHKNELKTIFDNPNFSKQDKYQAEQEKININNISTIAKHINSSENLNFSDNEFEKFIAHLFELNFAGTSVGMVSNKQEKENGCDFIMSYYFDDSIDINIQFNVQVKQHEGSASLLGIEQISKSDDSDSNVKNILVTSAERTPELTEFARERGVKLYTNKEIAEMIVNNFDELDEVYKIKLNILKSISVIEK